MSDFSSENFIRTLDSFFAREDIAGAGEYLREQYKLCNRENNDSAKLTVLNELIGFYRQTGEERPALSSIDEAVYLVKKLGISGEISGATVYLNCATTMKCFGKSAESLKYYDMTEKVYEQKLPADHPLVAGLYNNRALALQDIGKIRESEKFFRKAIGITLSDKKLALETAVSYVNLAHLLFDEDPLDQEVNTLLDGAYEILTSPANEGLDKYAFTCRKCAPSYGFFGRFIDEKTLNERADRAYARD